MVQSPRSDSIMETLFDCDRRVVGRVHIGRADHAQAAAAGIVGGRTDLNDNRSDWQPPGGLGRTNHNSEEQGVHLKFAKKKAEGLKHCVLGV